MAATRGQQTVTCDMTMSLDGVYSGPAHLDDGFMRIMDWIHQAMAWRKRYGQSGGDNIDADAVARLFNESGSYVMGRTMFDLGEDPWGPTPPFRAPVFVVTSHPRAPIVKDGGTTFTFVTDGVAQAVELARQAAGERNVAISGGGKLVRATLAAGLIDELHLHIAPVLLGDGMALFGAATTGSRKLEPAHVAHSPRATHLTYRLT